MGCQKLPGDAPETHIRPIEPTPIRWQRILAYDLKLNLAIAKNVHQRRSYFSPSFESTTWMGQETERFKLRQSAPSDPLYSGQHARLVLGTSDRRLWRRSCDLG